MPVGMPRADDYKAVHDYYRVLNVILTAGVVMEIMLVPPVIDRKQGITDDRITRSSWVKYTGLSKRNGAKLGESFCPPADNHSRPSASQAGGLYRAL